MGVLSARSFRRFLRTSQRGPTQNALVRFYNSARDLVQDLYSVGFLLCAVGAVAARLSLDVKELLCRATQGSCTQKPNVAYNAQAFAHAPCPICAAQHLSARPTQPHFQPSMHCELFKIMSQDCTKVNQARSEASGGSPNTSREADIRRNVQQCDAEGWWIQSKI